jgi:hypothetical protein
MTTLYRIFDATGELLWVGMTDHFADRFSAHKRCRWGDEIASCTTEEHADRDTAHRAEARAIRAEGPRYNIEHNWEWRAPVTPAAYMTTPEGRAYATRVLSSIGVA